MPDRPDPSLKASGELLVWWGEQGQLGTPAQGGRAKRCYGIRSEIDRSNTAGSSEPH